MRNISFRDNILPVLTLMLLCSIVYGNSFHEEFMIDDYVLLFKNSGIESFDTLDDFLKRPLNGFYRPIATLFLKGVFSLCAAHPYLYHVVNLLLFFIVGVLIFVNVSFLVGDRKTAWFVSCLYCVHPIHTIFVNYKTAGMLTVFVIFSHLSILCFLKYLNHKDRRFYLLSLFSFLFALLSHEMSCMVPIYLVAIMYFLKKLAFKENFMHTLPYLVIIAVYVFVRAHIKDARAVDSLFRIDISAGSYFATLVALISWYISKLLIPQNILFAWDGVIIKENFFIGTAISAIILAICLYMIFIKWGRGVKAFSLFLFLFGFLPMGLASFVYTPKTHTALVEPHWFAISSMGFFILVAQVLISLNSRINRKQYFLLIVVIFFTLGLLTRAHNASWKDELTFCSYWIKVNKLNVTPYISWAEACIRKNDKGLQKKYYTDYRTVLDLAKAYHILEDEESAKKYYSLAVEMTAQ